MNHWQAEFLAEYHRQRLREEVRQIRLGQRARRFRAHRPALVERMIFNVANWMISTGRQLRERYEPSYADPS